MSRRGEQLASLALVGLFIYVIAHRERYHVSRFGFYYGLVALIALGALYTWAWRGEVERRKVERLLDRAALAEEWCVDSGEPFTESKRSPLPPGEN